MNEWLDEVCDSMERFSRRYSLLYQKTKRELYASFEIGCFLALIRYYETMGCTIQPENLIDREYRYLTTPNGNPSNFSYATCFTGSEAFDIRQQVRIVSHIDSRIAFTPDIVVLRRATTIHQDRDSDYANGKRSFFHVNAVDVIALHECKSLPPFPELLVSFLGLVFVGSGWLNDPRDRSVVDPEGLHLAPTLFVGGSARSVHLRMVKSLKATFPINIVLGMHSGTWDLSGRKASLTRMQTPISDTGAQEEQSSSSGTGRGTTTCPPADPRTRSAVHTLFGK